MCVTRDAYARISGATASTCAASPPAITASVPAVAPPTPPDTGASTQPTPAAAARCARLRVTAGGMLE